MPRYPNNNIFEEWKSTIVGVSDPTEIFKFIEKFNSAARTKSGKGPKNFLGKGFVTFIRRCFVLEYRVNRGLTEKQVANRLWIIVKTVKNDMEWFRDRRKTIVAEDVHEEERRYMAMWMILLKLWKEKSE